MAEPTRAQQETEKQNEEIVRQAYQSYVNNDLESVLNICSDEIEWKAFGPPDLLPYAGVHRGRDQIARYFQILDDSEESNHLVPEEFIAIGDRVIVFGNYRARVNATGERFDTDFVHVFTLKDGKLTNFRDFYDTSAVVKAYHPE